MGTFTDEDFDPATWDELLELFGRDGVAEMLGALQGDLPQQRQKLDAALAAQDRGAIKRIAHSLRGVALQFGATSLAEYCGGIERAVAGDAPLAAIAADAAIMLDRQLALTQRLNETLHGR
jgi:HPt (histidine-containing phosphotransfer) domain-containing protein